MQALQQAEWTVMAKRHEARLAPTLLAHRQRQKHGIKHPICDFLFTYYSFPVRSLVFWQPGYGITLCGDDEGVFTHEPFYTLDQNGIRLDITRFPPHRIDSLKWVISLLQQTQKRPPRYSCLGLHEWAMVYKSGTVRHANLPLRMQEKELSSFVESQNINCTHYDAFRFFTEKAKPLNIFQPIKEAQQKLEQPGCVHANMDIYKWAYKFHPWVGSDLIADAFLLAEKARTLDMRASPYDCTSLGVTPITIETPSGKAIYIEEQRAIAEKAALIREELLNHLIRLKTAITKDGN